MAKIGIIGGSGLENLDFFEQSKKIKAKTKYGAPSSELLCGTIGKNEVVILSRHDKNHTITPSKINNRANIMALKEAGCTHIIATTACGSLQGHIHRGDIVFLNQFIDFTKHRETTFFDEFGNDELNHTPMASPFDEYLRTNLIAAASKIKIRYHIEGTVVTIEGPRFSTQAESRMFKLWGADVINMTTAPEAILANEIGIPYAAIALSTDYDCWKVDENAVTWEEVLAVFKSNVENLEQLLLAAVDSI
ncbi:MAG: S-methyl-5'-thioadenosine phosphorylase [Bacteroidota bacterium]